MAKREDGSISTVGRRKEAIARVRLFKGKSSLIVNGKPISEYFTGAVAEKIYSRPFEVSGVRDGYGATVLVAGGGQASQLGAVVHGLSRALAKMDKKLRFSLKRAGFLTRDARVKERRKYGLAQKARAKKQSPKR